MGCVAGLWNTVHDRFALMICPDFEACVGAPPTVLNFGRGGNAEARAFLSSIVEGCTVGHTGTLCDRCQAGYGRRGRGLCKTCTGSSLVFLTGVAMVYAIAAVFMLTALWHTTHPASRLFTLFVPALNFLQLLGLSLWFRIRWPAELIGVFRGAELMSTFTEQLMPLDCTFYTPWGSVHYFKTLWYVLLPAMLFAASGVNWFVVFVWRWRYIRYNRSLHGTSQKRAAITGHKKAVIEGSRLGKNAIPGLVANLGLNLTIDDLKLGMVFVWW